MEISPPVPWRCSSSATQAGSAFAAPEVLVVASPRRVVGEDRNFTGSDLSRGEGRDVGGREWSPLKWQRALAVSIVGAAPLTCMLFFLRKGGGPWLPMLTLHWLAMFLAPLLYCLVAAQGFAREAFVSEAKALRAAWSSRVWTGVTLLLTEAAVAALATYSAIYVCQFFLERAFDFQLRAAVREALVTLGFEKKPLVLDPCGGALGVGLYFSFVNPVVEEIFWRVFLRRELAERILDSIVESGDHSRLPLLRAPSTPTSTIINNNNNNNPTHSSSSSSSSSGRRLRGPESLVLEEGGSQLAVLQRQRLSLCPAVLLSLFYSSYHLVVVARLLGARFVGPAFAVLVGLGLVLNAVRETPVLGGILAAMALHVGVDAAACLFALESMQLF